MYEYYRITLDLIRKCALCIRYLQNHVFNQLSYYRLVVVSDYFLLRSKIVENYWIFSISEILIAIFCEL